MKLTLAEMRAALADRPEFRFTEFEGMTVGCYMVASDETFRDSYSLECRGVTFDADGSVIGRPLPKFFNVGERADTQPSVIDWSQLAEIYEKRDGSLIHTVKTPDGYRLKSKKSFTAPQVLAAQQWVDARPAVHEWLTKRVASDLTVIMEWTAPDNRVVIAYDQPQLTVLHIRSNSTGSFVQRATLEQLCADVVPLVATCDLDRGRLLELAQNTASIEGWVLRFSDGTLMKLKTKWYLEHHHYMTALRERDVAEAVLDEKVDDIKTVLATDDVESLARVQRIERGVVEEIEQLARDVDALFAASAGKDRKTVAIEHREHPLFSLLMQRFSGKEPDFKKHYRRCCLDARWSLDCITTFGKRSAENDQDTEAA